MLCFVTTLNHSNEKEKPFYIRMKREGITFDSREEAERMQHEAQDIPVKEKKCEKKSYFKIITGVIKRDERRE